MKLLNTTEERMAYKAILTKGLTKIAPKGLDCEFYIGNIYGRPRAMCFAGTAGKPRWSYTFKTEENRERYIRETIAAFEEKAKREAARKSAAAQPSKFEVGHILVTCWGYDQTNREFFKVTKILGKTMIEVRELEQITESTGWLRGKALPTETFKDKAPVYRCRVTFGSLVRIEGHHASLWDGKPVGWTAYA